MKVVCAWCGKTMGVKAPYENKDITHGACPECLKKELAKIEKGKKHD